jgi:hypothetical protein
LGFAAGFVAARRQIAGQFCRDVWEDIRPAARALLGDMAIFLIGLLVLAVVYLALHVLRVIGYDQARLEIFELMHYITYLVVFAMLLLDLILKVGTLIWKRPVGIYAPDED